MMFSDIERSEAVAICEALITANRVDMIVDCLRQGATLRDVQRLLATEAIPAAPAAAPVPAPPRLDTDRALEEAAARRFRAQAGGVS